ncbi:MAG TPA: hemin uptake protein HemP [Opitutaceae bacterium]|jgi:hemin uptake protein HemP|nr:hemin uptake protein HemP [Opitutaceae bacterium]
MNTANGKNKQGNTGEPASTDAPRRTVELNNNRIDSRALFVDGREIVIAHGDETYRLRLTAQNKLILTK